MNKRIAATALFISQFIRPLLAQTTMSDSEPVATGYVNLVTPTLGGVQVWADELLFHDWRIQRNSLTGHYRLLDGRNFRHAWGSFDECRAKLDLIKREQKLPAMRGTAVIVLHGLFRHRGSMGKLSEYLADKGEYNVFTFGYASTRADVELHARSLARVLKNLEGIEEINLVAHSLGNLVIRRYLADATDEASGRKPDPRLRRIVMIGAPNNGAQLARTFSRTPLFSTVVGAVGHELGHGWNELISRLATPCCEFGIIAGGRGDGKGYSPLLPGDDDMVVTVEETRLPGARDFKVLPVLHSFMMNDLAVMEHTLRFLERGYFVSEEARQPIPLDDAQAKLLQSADDGKQ